MNSEQNLTREEAIAILNTPDEQLNELIERAGALRKKYKGNHVSIHLLTNARSGNCSQNCAYCAQSCRSHADIEKYKWVDDEKLYGDNTFVHDHKLSRHCIGLSGMKFSDNEIEELASKIRKMKEEGTHLCCSIGFLTKKQALMLKEAGFEDAIISASSDLDEYLIDSLKAQGAKVNSWGVGTNLITSKGHPAFGGVYKLAAIKNKEDEDFIPKIKLSENVEKVTNPGNKTIFRIYDKATGKIRADLICLADEVFDPEKDMIIFDPMATWKKTKIEGGTYTLRELLVPIFKKGECVYTSPSVMEIRDICQKEKQTLWGETLRLVNPQEVYVDLSDKLYKIKSDLLEEMSQAAIENE